MTDSQKKEAVLAGTTSYGQGKRGANPNKSDHALPFTSKVGHVCVKGKHSSMRYFPMYIYEALNQCEQKPVIGSLVKFQGAKDLGVPGLPSSYEGVVLDTNGDYHVVRVLKETPITVSGEKEYRIHPEPWTEDTYRLPHECISAVSMFTVNL